MFGYQASELMGKNLDILLPERFQTNHDRYVQYFGETGVTMRSMQRQTMVYGRHASGREFPIEAAISQVNMAGQKHYTAILRDATERQRTEDALQRTQKLESLGIFASGIAHDFNNLLIALMAESEAALFKMLPNQPARQNIQRIIQAAERGADLTQQLLAYSGEGQCQITAFDFNKLVAENREFLEAMLPKNIDLKMNLAADLPPVEADTGQIQQVVMNLIINAAEAYQGKAGPVEIETKLTIVEPRKLWPEGDQHLQPGTYVGLRVTDQGHGMDEETLAHIFDPFFTTKVSGRGLGLAAVQSIIRSHRGAMHVTSQIGQGTTFHVLLPAGNAHVPVAKVSLPNPQAKTGQILFIDDEDIVRYAITEILELNGYSVFQAENGGAGLTLFQQCHNEIDLVLLDMTMPIMAGDEVLQAIRHTHPDMPVLMLSGYEETEELKQAAATYFLKKPFKMDVLLTRLNEILD
jgi:PAS domain S-box-containing protein